MNVTNSHFSRLPDKSQYLNNFETIYKENYKTVYRFARKILNDHEMAADIAQEVFIDFYNQKTYGIKSIKSWLYRITANKCFDHHKKVVKERQLAKNDELYHTEEHKTEEKYRIVNEAISHLNERDKLLVDLYSEGIRYKEIASISRMNVSSVGKTLSRALKKLEKELKPNYHELFV